MSIVSREKRGETFKESPEVKDDVKDTKKESNKIFKKLNILSPLANKSGSVIWCAI